jgi:hypothetical protein
MQLCYRTATTCGVPKQNPRLLSLTEHSQQGEELRTEVQDRSATCGLRS